MQSYHKRKPSRSSVRKSNPKFVPLFSKSSKKQKTQLAAPMRSFRVVKTKLKKINYSKPKNYKPSLEAIQKFVASQSKPYNISRGLRSYGITCAANQCAYTRISVAEGSKITALFNSIDVIHTSNAAATGIANMPIEGILDKGLIKTYQYHKAAITLKNNNQATVELYIYSAVQAFDTGAEPLADLQLSMIDEGAAGITVATDLRYRPEMCQASSWTDKWKLSKPSKVILETGQETSLFLHSEFHVDNQALVTRTQAFLRNFTKHFIIRINGSLGDQAANAAAVGWLPAGLSVGVVETQGIRITDGFSVHVEHPIAPSVTAPDQEGALMAGVIASVP